MFFWAWLVILTVKRRLCPAAPVRDQGSDFTRLQRYHRDPTNAILDQIRAAAPLDSICCGRLAGRGTQTEPWSSFSLFSAVPVGPGWLCVPRTGREGGFQARI